ncbi:hypothetical protein [Kitasatospora sp. KL5]|uniref:hypothetical protein n=1 Tax=Kitasatospora sp. KL5 TaxID=3425125 RepID=UPI003D6EB7DB
MVTTRSAKEAHLYIDMHACDCGETSLEREHSIQKRDEALVAVYEGVCPGCGTERRFEFVLPETPAPAGKFGGDEPSAILDAGEFLAASDRYGDLAYARSRQGTPEARATVVPLLDEAIAALEEVFKFIPADAEEVPADAIASEAGRKICAANPGRFHRSHLAGGLENLHELRSIYLEP